jgi:hypothetical protein
VAPGCRHEREAPKDGSSADQPGSSQGRTGSRSESSANGEAKSDAEKSPEEVAAEHDRVPEVKAETRTEARTSSRRLPTRTIWFPKPDHPVSLGSEQKGTPRSTATGMASTLRWCPPSLMSNQKRRI